MKICFHGAARTVTGSKHRIVMDNGTQFLLDCGMFQGLGTETDELNASFGFDPSALAFVVLSHAHIDHTGLLPKLLKEGFTGPVYCTEATRDLTAILLHDCAEIQAYANLECPSLYTTEDVEKTMEQIQTIEPGTSFSPVDGIDIQFIRNGHLPGSVAVHITVTENQKPVRILYSGDIGRYRGTLLNAPADCPQADYIILESTYGNTHHDINFSAVDTLDRWIRHTCLDKQGKLVIPAFSVGRTQELLYTLNQLELEKRLPPLSYFVDSPLGHRATEVIKKHTGYFNEHMQKVLQVDDDPFLFDGLKYVDTTEDSKKLVEYKEACVIISASGTADAGRVRHHIGSCIDNPQHTVLMSGFCGHHSLGGRLLHGKKTIELSGTEYQVSAEIAKLEGMSAHADADDLCRFLSCQDKEVVKGIFLVHGEYLVQQEFAARLQRKGFQQVLMPGMNSETELSITERATSKVA